MLFLVVLFFLKNKSVFKNEENRENQAVGQNDGLTYNNEILSDLVNRDTDGDGILDWEESLWGTDPSKKDTNDDGILDNIEIAKIKSEEDAGGEINEDSQEIEALTETDKFSRELFSTIAALSQNGPLDQATIDKLSNSLAEQIKNPPIQKIFSPSELKVINDDSVQAVKNYDNALRNLYEKYPPGRTVIDVLQDFIMDEENVDITALSELDPINTQVQGIIADLVKINVPESLAFLHLDIINILQRLSENISDIQLFDTDVVVALGAISQYEANTDLLEEITTNLSNTIAQKLNN